jgi:hypothetical protein
MVSKQSFIFKINAIYTDVPFKLNILYNLMRFLNKTFENVIDLTKPLLNPNNSKSIYCNDIL